MPVNDSSYQNSKEGIGLSITALKVIALISMIIDHIGAVIFPHAIWMRGVGRLAMPIYCFCISEGMRYTSNRISYLIRMGLFALISEIPFDLAFYGVIGTEMQNVMVTFFLAILGITVFEIIRKDDSSPLLSVVAAFAAIAAAAAAEIIRTDYGAFGVLLVYIFYFLRNNLNVRLLAGAALVIVLFWNDGEILCLISFILLALYNGQRGPGLKYLFYAAYPAHLAVLAMISRYLL